ncbi:hypothetical protein [Arthrobacter sp. H35-D1]|uniref:hypothetical protein n=1 Tax=Arthrobacter sp. H35-D1 TaxID=3046202 RepID=UPI0024BB5E81|nr:hypothetical protein [Arthrobacter sp. H35-D1]MDJ0314219.1 hypothetical protein [Arthrobacter sp. H35-D1]
MSAQALSEGTHEGHLRPSNTVMDPLDMGGARATRHSFMRTMMRRAVNNGWQIQRTAFDIDEGGCGSAIYEIHAESLHFSFVAFSQRLKEEDRTDRVIAKGWDLTAALVEGPVDSDKLERLAADVPLQENGRAETGSIIWTRANRSERFFDYVADRLAHGLQPETGKFGGSPYLIRSTAFYSNGKCGLADYESLEDGHPLAAPFRAHMLTAWLLRELSYDMVEKVASSRNPEAARLQDPWRRYLGMGNATGLGMVPYAINHPEVINSWAMAREIPLAAVTARWVGPADASVPRITDLMDQAIAYLAEQDDIITAPFTSGPELSAQLVVLVDQLREWTETGIFAGYETSHIWRELHNAAAVQGPAARGMVATILTELTEDLDEVVESGLRCDESRRVTAGISCAALAANIDASYSWIGAFDFASPGSQKHFWFSSINNEEPRRALQGADLGEAVQHPVDIARAVAALRAELAEADPSMDVGEFLLTHPRHRATVGRVQNIGALPYGEVRDNLLGSEFLPLNVQRFQLALYGMENYTPQSTDWLRVTLMAGAPRIADLANGTADDGWMFTRRPQEENSND